MRVNDALPQISQRAIMFGSFLAGKPRPVGGELHKEFLKFLKAGSIHEGFDQAPGEGGNGRRGDDMMAEGLAVHDA